MCRLQCTCDLSSSSPPQAIRASAAAPYYLDDFTVGEERFQDGSAIANNPTLVGIQQVWMKS